MKDNYLQMRIDTKKKKEIQSAASKSGLSVTSFIIHLFELYKKKWRAKK